MYTGLSEKYRQMSNDEVAREMQRRGLMPIGGGSQENDDESDDDEDEDADDDNEDDSAKTAKSKAKSYSEAEFQAAFKKRLARETKKLTGTLTESIKAQVVKDMELQAATKKGDLQVIIDDLRPKAEKVETLEKRLEFFEELAEARFEEVLAGLPEAVRDLAPDDDADILEKEKWLVVKANAAVEKMRKKGLLDTADEDDDDETTERRTSSTKTRGFNPKEPGARSKNKKRTVEEIVKGYTSSGQYRPLM